LGELASNIPRCGRRSPTTTTPPRPIEVPTVPAVWTDVFTVLGCGMSGCFSPFPLWLCVVCCGVFLDVSLGPWDVGAFVVSLAVCIACVLVTALGIHGAAPPSRSRDCFPSSSVLCLPPLPGSAPNPVCLESQSCAMEWTSRWKPVCSRLLSPSARV
jgi:hypothetical protein